MGIATGRPRGRPKGAKNKRTVEREADMREMAARIGNAVGGAFEGDALAYLTSIYKDPAKPENVRMDAAKAAIRYERVALAPVEQAPETDFVPLAERLTRYVGTDAWERRPARLLEWEKAGVREEPALAHLPSSSELWCIWPGRRPDFLGRRRTSVLPEVTEALRGRFGIANSVLDVPVTQVVLKSSSVLAIIS
jgi:hypothetical protein